mmetsp:Transcript_16998/g.59470  ORF Transcript_16998/g.59470 Transcript_16998/m.59470 type:complete len:381 (-) Transcript_16998:3-1145(-)
MEPSKAATMPPQSTMRRSRNTAEAPASARTSNCCARQAPGRQRKRRGGGGVGRASTSSRRPQSAEISTAPSTQKPAARSKAAVGPPKAKLGRPADGHLLGGAARTTPLAATPARTATIQLPSHMRPRSLLSGACLADVRPLASPASHSAAAAEVAVSGGPKRPRCRPCSEIAQTSKAEYSRDSATPPSSLPTARGTTAVLCVRRHETNASQQYSKQPRRRPMTSQRPPATDPSMPEDRKPTANNLAMTDLLHPRSVYNANKKGPCNQSAATQANHTGRNRASTSLTLGNRPSLTASTAAAPADAHARGTTVSGVVAWPKPTPNPRSATTSRPGPNILAVCPAPRQLRRQRQGLQQRWPHGGRSGRSAGGGGERSRTCFGA